MDDVSQFWIDVGGTFTDCLHRSPDGELRRHKLLSSAATPGTVGASSTARQIVDPLRRADPDRFWAGFQLRLLDRDGHVIAAESVTAFDSATGCLELTADLPLAPAVGQMYELASDEQSPLVGIRYLLGLSRRDPIPPVDVRLGTTRGTNALITRRGPRTALVTTRGFADVLRIGYQDRPKLFELDIVKPVPLFESVIEIDERVSAAGAVLLAPTAEQTQQAPEHRQRRRHRVTGDLSAARLPSARA